MNRDWFEGWKGQYNRMLRWRDRANEALKQNNDGNAIYDFIYAFFQNSYHLRDWIVSDGAATKEEMKSLFSSSIELQLCRDICNATKHLQYNNSSIDTKPRISREWDHFENKDAEFSLYSDKRRPVPELMTQCVNAWNEFLEQKGLLNS